MLFLFAGLFGISLNIGAFFLGILHTESINSPIISSAGPVFVIIGSILFLGEHPTRKMLLGNLLALSGVMLIVLEPLFHANTLSSIGGNLLLILATLGSIVGTLLVKKLSKRYSALTLTFWTFAVGTITFLPFAFQEYQQFGLASQLQFPGLMGILYGAIFSSFVAYTLLYWALRYLMASQTTIFTYMDPVVAILIAAPLIHEYPSIFFIMGSILVFSGMWVAEGRINYHPLHKLFR